MTEEKIVALKGILQDVNALLELYPDLSLRRQQAEKTKPISLILSDTLFRINSNVFALEKVMGASGSNDFGNIYHAVGLVIRSSLSDAFRVFYIISKLDKHDGFNNLEYQEKLALEIHADQLDYQTRTLEKLIQNATKDRKQYLTEVKLGLEKAYPNGYQFDPKRKSQSVLYVKNILEENARFKWDASMAFELWLMYSAHEHYGPLSNLVAGLPVTEKWQSLCLSLQVIIHSINYAFNSLGDLKKHSNRLEKMLDEIEVIK